MTGFTGSYLIGGIVDPGILKARNVLDHKLGYGFYLTTSVDFSPSTLLGIGKIIAGNASGIEVDGARVHAV